VGVTEHEVMVIEMAKDYSAPHPSQRSMIKTFKFSIPFLDLKSMDEAKKDLTIPQIEENLMRD
jgi:hypothetical protein